LRRSSRGRQSFSPRAADATRRCQFEFPKAFTLSSLPPSAVLTCYGCFGPPPRAETRIHTPFRSQAWVRYLVVRGNLLFFFLVFGVELGAAASPGFLGADLFLSSFCFKFAVPARNSSCWDLVGPPPLAQELLVINLSFSLVLYHNMCFFFFFPNSSGQRLSPFPRMKNSSFYQSPRIGLRQICFHLLPGPQPPVFSFAVAQASLLSTTIFSGLFPPSYSRPHSGLSPPRFFVPMQRLPFNDNP